LKWNELEAERLRYAAVRPGALAKAPGRLAFGFPFTHCIDITAESEAEQMCGFQFRSVAQGHKRRKENT